MMPNNNPDHHFYSAINTYRMMLLGRSDRSAETPVKESNTFAGYGG
jgi:hypothetical protein